MASTTVKKEKVAKLAAEQEEALKEGSVSIAPPNIQMAAFRVRGDSPYCQGKFGKSSQEEMERKQREGSKANKGKKKEPKDFDKLYEEALRRDAAGWYGFSAVGLRTALIRACSLTGYKMTLMKLAIKMVPDGYDKDDQVPLFRITKGEPKQIITPMSNDNGGTDLRVRGLWAPGWESTVTIAYDADLLSKEDVANLLMRAGAQVGIGQGRNNSKNCAGCGWGSFVLLGRESAAAPASA